MEKRFNRSIIKSPSTRFARSGQAGVTMVHFAIVVPLLFLFALVIIDFSYTLTVESLLDEAVHRTVTQAVTVSNLDIDPTNKDLTDPEFRRFVQGRIQAIDLGTRFLDSTRMVYTKNNPPASTDATRLLEISYSETRTTGTPPDIKEGIMILLPGECARVTETGETVCNRETLGSSNTDPAPQQPPAFLMETHPIKAFAIVNVDTYTPFLDGRKIRVQAYAYREPIPQGPFAHDTEVTIENPPPAPTPVGTPGPTPPAPAAPTPLPLVCEVMRCVNDQLLTAPPSRYPIVNVTDADGYCICPDPRVNQ